MYPKRRRDIDTEPDYLRAAQIYVGQIRRQFTNGQLVMDDAKAVRLIEIALKAAHAKGYNECMDEENLPS